MPSCRVIVITLVRECIGLETEEAWARTHSLHTANPNNDAKQLKCNVSVSTEVIYGERLACAIKCRRFYT